MDETARTVFIVDGCWDSRVRLSNELTSAGYWVRPFGSAERFLAAQDARTPGCVLLDIVLPGMSGLDLQQALSGSRCARPLVFLADRADIESGVQAIKGGAIDFFTKPISGMRLLAAVERALRCDAAQRRDRAIQSVIKERFESLTQREQEVMTCVIQGRLNKQIAADLGTGLKTVKVHRGRVMAKMGARSVAELVLLGARIGAALEPTLATDPNGLIWRLALRGEKWRPHASALTPAQTSVTVLADRDKGLNRATRHLNLLSDTGRMGASIARLGAAQSRWSERPSSASSPRQQALPQVATWFVNARTLGQ